MTRHIQGHLRLEASSKARSGWDNTDESKSEIEQWVTLLGED